MGDFLEEVRALKRSEIDALGRAAARRRREGRLAAASPPRDFRAALSGGSGHRIIAEIKKASPSRGVLRREFEPARLALHYREGGAAALSVLTDECYFQGSPAHLEEARRAADLPALRKDFLIDSVQVEESRAMGADAVLLIVRLLSSRQLSRLMRETVALGMAPLVEVHAESELAIALDSGADLIGVNSRDLGSFQVDPEVCLRLAKRIPGDVLAIAESGIRERSDLDRLAHSGYRAFLVGERLMTAPDPTALLKEWTR
ncbi:MAG TPA: indole-3-glycerol phosphate synthase TrpC [Candidatus Polarisedimenticolia bacterium]|jgi:indole-3-glycerol phosphate synthase|nr:indole-3-glycerol phosphate synthase TrpC [Candidatus Polarisedimenticolia bacterium]